MLSTWSARRSLVASVATLATGLFISLGTAMIANPVIGRSIPPTWWSWPVMAVTALLSGLLFATYVREPGAVPAESQVNRRGAVGGALSFFAVGCPVCNKVALLLLGSAGAVQWFAPIQPYLGIAGIALLAWALRTRLAGERSCPIAVPGPGPA